MKTMQIKIRALDTLFFRDGKPFSMGEETWADGIFPPPPSVFYGALRTLYFSENPSEISKLERGIDNSLALRINNLILSKQENPFFIIPNDYVKVKNRDKYTLLSLAKNDSFLTSYMFDHELRTQEELEDIEPNHFLTSTDFAEYLKGTCQSKPRKFNIYTEPKVGIGRNKKTNTTIESQLYRVGMKRLSDEDNNCYEFVLDITGLFDWTHGKKFVKIGGEGKIADFEIVKPDNNITIQTISQLKSQYFKVVLTNPAIFTNGWYPSFVDESKKFQGKWNGVNVQLVSAAVGKPSFIGGFDMNNKKPKVMFKAVPAGSVYYFKILDSFDSNIFESIPQPFKITDQRSDEGFGTAYLGNATITTNEVRL